MKCSSQDFAQASKSDIIFLKIEQNNFDLNQLKACIQLEVLEIVGTSHEVINLEVISYLEKLKTITILNNKQLEKVVLPDVINASLTKLLLINNRLSTIPQNIRALTRLDHLRLERNKLKDIGNNIDDISFKLLDLSRNELITLSDSVYNNSYLETLILSNNNLSTVDVQCSNDFNSLKTLFFNKNNIIHFNFFIKNNHVTSLFLSSNNLEVFPACLKNYAALEKLYIGSNPLIEFIPNWIADLKYLKMLDISGLENLDIANVTKLIAIEDLNMSFCDLDTFPEEIVSLVNLKCLKLNFNSTKQIPPTISKLINATHLEFRDNDLTDIPNELYHLPSLEHINLEYNSFSKEAKARIADKFSSKGVECIV